MEIYAFGTARASDLYVREKFIMAAAPPVCSVSFPRPWGFSGKIHSQSTHAAPKKKTGQQKLRVKSCRTRISCEKLGKERKKNYSRFTTRTYDPSGTSASSNLVDQRGAAEKKRTLSAITAGSSILIHHSLRPAAASTRLILTAGPSTAGSSGVLLSAIVL